MTMTEFLIGGLACCGAGLFTNPLEVVKTRMQLQGELQARGQYTVHYRNVFHAFYNIAKVDGVLALQKGLVPALWYQFFMNGIRLGAYQCFANWGLIHDSRGNVVFYKSVMAGALAGCVGASFGSPIYMVKTHLQSLAHTEIAVGHQHQHNSMVASLRYIYSEQGMRGLWRGVSAAATRVMFGSAAQLSTYSTTKHHIVERKIFPKDSWLNALLASMFSGVAVVIVMTPFDVVSTRLYNQNTDQFGRGLLYRGMSDCFLKTFNSEGVWGFYKGWAASFLRVAPHTVLSLLFWHLIRREYVKARPNS